MSKKPKHRARRVITSTLVPRTGAVKLWAYGYADLAVFFRMSEEAVRKAVSDGKIDPSSFHSIIAFFQRRALKKPENSAT